MASTASVGFLIALTQVAVGDDAVNYGAGVSPALTISSASIGLLPPAIISPISLRRDKESKF